MTDVQTNQPSRGVCVRTTQRRGSHCRAPYRRAQSGLGIIEVLVALVVVSFGVLGMAGLQLTGMKHSTSGYNRSKALLLAENMATRMRINQPAVTAASYAGVDSNNVDCATPPVPYCQARPSTGAVACTTAELAVFDIYSVSCGDLGTTADSGVKGMLPGGQLAILCNDAPCVANSSYTVTVTWNERAARSDDQETRRVQMRLRP